MALQRQVFSIPISAGVDTKTDDKQVIPGKALSLENVRFEKTGKLQKRYGLVALPTSSSDSLLATSTIKALVSDDDYLAVKTSAGIYGYSKTVGQWEKQANYSGSFSLKTEYIARNYDDQAITDQDTSIDGFFTVYGSLQFGTNDVANIILKDNQTGLVKKLNISVDVSTNSIRVFCQLFQGVYRVVVLVNSAPSQTLFYVLDSNLGLISNGTLPGFGALFNFYATRDSSNIYVVNNTSGTLTLRKLTFDGVVVASATITNANIRASTSAIAMTVADGVLHLVYSAVVSTVNVFNFVAINTSLTFNAAGILTYIKTGFLTPICAFKNGVLYYGAEFSNMGGILQTNGINLNKINFNPITGYGSSAGTLNVDRLRVATEPFIVDDQVYIIVYTWFNTPSNSKSFYIFNFDTGNVTQVFSPELATVHGAVVSKSTVVGTKVYSSIIRQVGAPNDAGETFPTISSTSVILEYGENYFDNTKVKVDKRIYLCDGGLIEMDKGKPHENGFVLSPEFKTITTSPGSSGNPNIASKTFSYAITYEFFDSEGQKTVSAPAFFTTLGLTPALTVQIRIIAYDTVGSLKFNGDTLPGGQPEAFRPKMVVYRTTNNGSIYYRIGTAVMLNDGSDVNYFDTAADSTIVNNEVLYTTGGVLENNPAPPADFCFSGGNRIFLGGLEERDEIAFSKKQLFGESVAFSNLFRIRVSTGLSFDRSPISAGGYMDGKIIIFRKQSIYFCQGDGPNELGIGEFSSPEIISSDVGCVEPRSVVNMPLGLMFKSKKGIYLLSRGLAVSYIGAEVEAFNQYNVYASVLAENFNEVRFYLTNGQCLVYNYFFQAWSVFTDQGTTDADIWQSNPVVVKSGKIQVETPNIFKDDGSFYSMKYISPWLKMELIQGFMRCYQLWIIGNFKSAHTLKCDVTTDYLTSPVEQYSLVYNNTDEAQYQFQISLPKQKVESIKFELYDINHGVGSTGESYELSNIQLEAGIKAGGYKLAASKSY